MFGIDPEYFSIYISVFSLLVAILSLPFSYWVSMKIIKKQLNETDNRKSQKAIKGVIESLNEFFLIFYSAVDEIVKIDRNTVNANPRLIDPFLSEIDIFIKNTGIYLRLESAINNLLQTETQSNPLNNETKNQLLSIRNLIQKANSENRILFLNIISSCEGDKMTDSLKRMLRVGKNSFYFVLQSLNSV